MIRTAIALVLLGWGTLTLAAPAVVVSIPPIHSLVAAVMADVEQPHLLIDGGASPHAYALKPSDARALGGADLIVWTGEGMEPMLPRPLSQLSGVTIIELATLPGMELLPSREGGVWGEHQRHDHHHGESSPQEYDWHLWLTPSNARTIVKMVAGRLMQMDADNADQYRVNRDRTLARIDALDSQLTGQLEPLRSIPYLVFHDAYHYFEDAYGLHPVGAITVSPDRAPSARRLHNIREGLKSSGAVCVFSEPQFPSPLVEVVLEGSSARHGTLDPLGTRLTSGPELWFSLMQNLGDDLQRCLTAK